MIATRKVRVFPQDESEWDNLIGLNRVAYNMAIAAINEGKPNQIALRISIREELRERWEEYDSSFVSTVCDEAVNEAFRTLTKCVRKWKKGDKSRLRFRSKRDVRQGFWCNRCATGGQILPRHLGKSHLTEELDVDPKGQTVRITRVRGRYFVSYHQTVLSENQAGNRVAAIDPGVRTFATCFSSNNVVKYGDDFKSQISKLSDRHDYFRSLRDKLPSLKIDSLQWVKDRHAWVLKKLNKISNRIHDLVDDLHRRVAFDLVQNHDVILMPHFQTKQMVKKKKGRKIGRGTVRSMQNLSFYKFTSHLEWMCKKYGKKLVRVNEAYTSKIDSRTGEIKNVGGSTKINGLDRDTNGARGILLRALSRAA